MNASVANSSLLLPHSVLWFLTEKASPFYAAFVICFCLHFWSQHSEAAVMAGTTALPLHQFIASLDDTCLPRILQVCSGVYFQGRPFIVIFFLLLVNWNCELDEDKDEEIRSVQIVTCLGFWILSVYRLYIFHTCSVHWPPSLNPKLDAFCSQIKIWKFGVITKFVLLTIGNQK